MGHPISPGINGVNKGLRFWDSLERLYLSPPFAFSEVNSLSQNLAYICLNEYLPESSSTLFVIGQSF